MLKKKRKTDLKNKVLQISEKGFELLLGRMYFTGNDGYHDFLVFAPMLSSLILDSNRKVTNCISFECHLKLNHLILALNRQCLTYLM